MTKASQAAEADAPDAAPAESAQAMRRDLQNDLRGKVRAFEADLQAHGLNANAVDLVAMTKSIWEYSTTSISLAGSVGQLMKDNLDAKVSTRSVYAGGPVVSVTQPVTVGTNQDKSGYSLNANGVDLVMVETGVNLRQAVSPILAATAGVISGASTGQITIKGGNNTATRIVATTDNIGNRTTVVLTLPV